MPAEMLPVIQNLTALGCSEADIGLIVGYAGKNPEWFMKNRKRTDPAVKEAWDMGKKMVKVQIMQSLVRTALGYDYQEKTETFKSGPNGEMCNRPIEKKVTTKHSKPDTKALELLAYNLMGDDFKRKMEVENKSVNLELSGELQKDDIRKLAGKLLQLAETKKVESNEISNPQTSQTTDKTESSTTFP